MVTLANRLGCSAVRVPSIVTSIRFRGTFVSRACPTMRVTPHDDIPARKASLLVRTSPCGCDDESRVRRAPPCAWLMARPTAPLLEDLMVSTLSLLMAAPRASESIRRDDDPPNRRGSSDPGPRWPRPP